MIICWLFTMLFFYTQITKMMQTTANTHHLCLLLLFLKVAWKSKVWDEYYWLVDYLLIIYHVVVLHTDQSELVEKILCYYNSKFFTRSMEFYNRSTCQTFWKPAELNKKSSESELVEKILCCSNSKFCRRLIEFYIPNFCE